MNTLHQIVYFAMGSSVPLPIAIAVRAPDGSVVRVIPSPTMPNPLLREVAKTIAHRLLWLHDASAVPTALGSQFRLGESMQEPTAPTLHETAVQRLLHAS